MAERKSNFTISYVDDDHTMDHNNSFSTDENYAVISTNNTNVFLGYGWTFWSVFQLIIIIVGTAANALMLVVLLKNKGKKTSNTLYVGAMVVNDIICLNVHLVYVWTYENINYDVNSTSRFTCKFMQALWSSTFYITGWLVIGLTTERLTYAYFPRMIKLFSRRMTGVIAISCVVCAAFVINLHYMVQLDLYPDQHPNDNTTIYFCALDSYYGEFINLYSSYVFFFLAGILPCMCILIGNSYTIQALCKSIKAPVPTGQRQISLENRDMLVFTIMISIMFLFMEMPFTVSVSFYMHFQTSFLDMITTIWLLNHSLKCFVYILYKRSFRIRCIWSKTLF